MLVSLLNELAACSKRVNRRSQVEVQRRASASLTSHIACSTDSHKAIISQSPTMSRSGVQPGNYRSKSGNVSYAQRKNSKHLSQANTAPKKPESKQTHVVHDTTVIEGRSNGSTKWKRVSNEVESRFIIPLSHRRIKLRTGQAEQ